MINIIIAENHELIRLALLNIFRNEIDINVVGEAKNSLEIFEQLRKTECDILLLNLVMPDRSGLDIITELKILKPRLRILVISLSYEEKYAIRALKAGACGFISNDFAISELLSAIRKIKNYGKYISPSLADQIANDLCSDKVQLPHELLSNREFEIMCLIASNKKNNEIASWLSLSINTVNTYRARIFEKMNIRSNVELTHYALDARLVD